MRLRSCRILIVALAVVAASPAGPSVAQSFNAGPPAGPPAGGGGSGGLATGVLIGAGIVAGGLLIGAARRPSQQTIDVPPYEPDRPIRPVRGRFISTSSVAFGAAPSSELCRRGLVSRFPPLMNVVMSPMRFWSPSRGK